MPRIHGLQPAAAAENPCIRDESVSGDGGAGEPAAAADNPGIREGSVARGENVRAVSGEGWAGPAATGPSAAPVAVFGAPPLSLAERLAPAWTALSLLLATAAFVVATVAWGLSPRQPLALAGLTASGLPLTLFQALAGARRSVWAGLILAGALGALLGWRRGQIFQGMRGWQEGIMAVVSLEWLYQAVVAALAAAGSAFQYFARLGEGEGYIGWLALAGLILWILLRS